MGRDFRKVLKVIESCRDIKQIRSAYNYASLFVKKYEENSPHRIKILKKGIELSFDRTIEKIENNI